MIPFLKHQSLQSYYFHEEMPISYILLGSNLGDKQKNLENTCQMLEMYAGQILQKSSIYQTMPWGIETQPLFFNQVLRLTTDLAPLTLLGTTQEIEKKLGKIKVGKWRERLIDIDILYYDNLIYQSRELTIPHSYIQDRRFTLVPLCEIARQFIHPIFKKSTQELLDGCKDPLEVRVADLPSSTN